MVNVKESVMGLQVLSDAALKREKHPVVRVTSLASLEQLSPGSVVVIKTNETGSCETSARYTGRHPKRRDEFRFYLRDDKESVRMIDVPFTSINLIPNGVLELEEFNTVCNFRRDYCGYSLVNQVLDEVGL